MGGAPWASLTLCAATRPAIDPAVVALLPLPSPIINHFMRYVAGCGLVVMADPEVEAAPALRRVRASAAAALFRPGCRLDVYEFDPRANRLIRLLAADADASLLGAPWFSPAEHLPGIAVDDVAAAVAALPQPAWAVGAVSAADVAAAMPAFTPSFAAMYAALASFAAREGAVPLLPPAQPVAQMAALRLAEEEEPDDWEARA